MENCKRRSIPLEHLKKALPVLNVKIYHDYEDSGCCGIAALGYVITALGSLRANQKNVTLELSNGRQVVARIKRRIPKAELALIGALPDEAGYDHNYWAFYHATEEATEDHSAFLSSRLWHSQGLIAGPHGKVTVAKYVGSTPDHFCKFEVKDLSRDWLGCGIYEDRRGQLLSIVTRVKGSIAFGPQLDELYPRDVMENDLWPQMRDYHG